MSGRPLKIVVPQTGWMVNCGECQICGKRLKDEDRGVSTFIDGTWGVDTRGPCICACDEPFCQRSKDASLAAAKAEDGLKLSLISNWCFDSPASDPYPAHVNWKQFSESKKTIVNVMPTHLRCEEGKWVIVSRTDDADSGETWRRQKPFSEFASRNSHLLKWMLERHHRQLRGRKVWLKPRVRWPKYYPRKWKDDVMRFLLHTSTLKVIDLMAESVRNRSEDKPSGN